ncbi:alginate export family protein [Acidithiobacillus sp. M4-SHS-6]|uniref:alginate export family protein n=1 Tax=Acidithiobacillus sp. M4-SHS-6 TaxID=3383024 RepID=UPI0039BDE71A
MNKNIAIICIITVSAVSGQICYADSVGSFLKHGTYTFQFRPRYEFAQQEGLRPSHAFTIRTMLGLKTAPVYGLSAYVQFINVAGIMNKYNSILNGKSSYTIIPDPEETGVNQFYLQYQMPLNSYIRVGRQEIVLDDSRFIGNVNFFQTPQSYDAISLNYNLNNDIGLYGAYIWRIKNILNQIEPTKSFVIEATVKPIKLININLFGYWYGNQSKSIIPGAPACGLPGIRSCNDQILGARATGLAKLSNNIALKYRVTYAKQLPYDGGSSLVNAHYLHGGAYLKYKSFMLGADYMLMGSNSTGTYGFQTPLATKHLFNGWADVFLTTPQSGLKSAYFTVKGNIDGLGLMARYYNFRSAYKNKAFGHEVDLSVIDKLTHYLNVGAQYADFVTSTNVLRNTQAGWVFCDLKFAG